MCKKIHLMQASNEGESVIAFCVCPQVTAILSEVLGRKSEKRQKEEVDNSGTQPTQHLLWAAAVWAWVRTAAGDTTSAAVEGAMVS